MPNTHGIRFTAAVNGIPEIFNTDQGCQFISEAFAGVLKAHGIVISMGGRVWVLDG